MNRHEYLVRAREFAVRGERLPQTKLTPDDIVEIRRIAAHRAAARAAINEQFSNEAIAARFGVHRRTVEKVLSWERM